MKSLCAGSTGRPNGGSLMVSFRKEVVSFRKEVVSEASEATEANEAKEATGPEAEAEACASVADTGANGS